MLLSEILQFSQAYARELFHWADAFEIVQRIDTAAQIGSVKEPLDLTISGVGIVMEHLARVCTDSLDSRITIGSPVE
ncbi:hypothetical protein GB937_010067 [Aspergillus fischeri]|nr:hypothetical protein GB937_010067 [Aspergillus fischeri]